MLFKIPMLPFITVMSHLSPRGREYRWGGCAPWRAVNNLRFCFIGNRDVVVVLCYRTPLGQGLQTHLSRLHHAEEVKSQFLFYFFTLKKKKNIFFQPIHKGGSSCCWVWRRAAAPQSHTVKGFVYQDALACFHEPRVMFCFDAMKVIACDLTGSYMI